MLRYSLILLSSILLSAHAGRFPQTGPYVGFYNGAIYSDKQGDATAAFGTIAETGSLITPEMSHSVGNDHGFVFGYRFNQRWHVNGDVFFGVNSINDVMVDGAPSSTITTLGTSGRNTTVAGFMNIIYDITAFRDDQAVDSHWVPYVGFGAGYLRTEQAFTFAGSIGGTELTQQTLKRRENTGAVQFLMGFNYYLDSYTAFFIDYRYRMTGSELDFLGERFSQHALNFGVNFNIDFMFN